MKVNKIAKILELAMIRILRAEDEPKFPALFESMFRHRAEQFHGRLGWDVQVDGKGCEIDQYEQLNPLYLIVEDDSGNHCGSLRFLPTTGRTMLNDHFRHITGGIAIHGQHVWECTRFCVARGAKPYTSRMVFLASMELGLSLGVEYFAGVFSKRMLGVYKRIGWVPKVIGCEETQNDILCVGLWRVSQARKTCVMTDGASANIHPDVALFCDSEHELLVQPNLRSLR